MYIYLTRHGETEWNLESRIQGSLDSRLTKRGIEDAKRLSQRLKDVDFDLAYSSTQGRAIETTEIILGERDTEIIKTPDLRELGVGSWEGQLYSYIRENHGDEFEIYVTQPHIYEPKNGGEDFYELEKRVERFIGRLFLTKAETVLVVTHGVTYLMLLNMFEGNELHQLSERKVPRGTALTKIHYSDGKYEIEYENDESHLD